MVTRIFATFTILLFASQTSFALDGDTVLVAQSSAEHETAEPIQNESETVQSEKVSPFRKSIRALDSSLSNFFSNVRETVGSGQEDSQSNDVDKSDE